MARADRDGVPPRVAGGARPRVRPRCDTAADARCGRVISWLTARLTDHTGAFASPVDAERAVAKLAA
jgi:hypothetical protein